MNRFPMNRFPMNLNPVRTSLAMITILAFGGLGCPSSSPGRRLHVEQTEGSEVEGELSPPLPAAGCAYVGDISHRIQRCESDEGWQARFLNPLTYEYLHRSAAGLVLLSSGDRSALFREDDGELLWSAEILNRRIGLSLDGDRACFSASGWILCMDANGQQSPWVHVTEDFWLESLHPTENFVFAVNRTHSGSHRLLLLDADLSVVWERSLRSHEVVARPGDRIWASLDEGAAGEVQLIDASGQFLATHEGSLSELVPLSSGEMLTQDSNPATRRYADSRGDVVHSCDRDELPPGIPYATRDGFVIMSGIEETMVYSYLEDPCSIEERVDGVDAPEWQAPQSQTCFATERMCGDECEPILNSRDHCGACGNACGGDTPICVDGRCSACPEGQGFCDERCMVPNTPDHCGDCGNVCDNDETCVDGSCEDAGYCYVEEDCEENDTGWICGNGYRNGAPPPEDYVHPEPRRCEEDRDCSRPATCVGGVCTPPCETCCAPMARPER